MTIRVLVADDQVLIRDGLAALCATASGLEVVGTAADGARAVALAAATAPDVVLMDIRMPAMDGIEATRRICARPGVDPTARVVVLTTFDLDEYVYGALAAGASGFLLKDMPGDRILGAVRTVASGDMLLAPQVTRRLIEHYSGHHRATAPKRARLGGLTARETEVLWLVGNGLTNAQIAARLVLSETTVKTHIQRIMGKLRLSSRAQAVVVAYETGLVVARGSRRPGH